MKIINICSILLIIFGCSAVIINSGEKNFNDGMSCFNKGDIEKSINFFEKAVSFENRNDKFLLWHGKALLERGQEEDMRQAIGDFKSALDNSRQTYETLLMIREIFFSRAEKYRIQKNNLMESRCYLAYTENFDQNDAEAYKNLGRIYTDMGDLVTGLFFAKKAFEIDPENREIIEQITEISHNFFTH
jgi:tetratricopeptide (TPR) repeat protein